MELLSALLSPSSKKKQKNLSRKNFSYFREWNFLAPRFKDSLYFKKLNFQAIILRNVLYFLKRKLFLYFGKWNSLRFQEMDTPKKFLRFQETELFYIWENENPEKIPYTSRNGNPKKLLIFQEVTFQD